MPGKLSTTRLASFPRPGDAQLGPLPPLPAEQRHNYSSPRADRLAGGGSCDAACSSRAGAQRNSLEGSMGCTHLLSYRRLRCDACLLLPIPRAVAASSRILSPSQLGPFYASPIHVAAVDGSVARVVPYRDGRVTVWQLRAALHITPVLRGQSWCRGPGSSGSASANSLLAKPNFRQYAAGKGTRRGQCSDSGAMNLRRVACMQRQARRHAPGGRS